MSMRSLMWMMAMAASGLFVFQAAADEPRVASLGGAVTETIWALGAGDRVVAVDASSTYPAEIANLPHVGYYRMISAEGVLSVNPDVVLASDEAGPPQALEQLTRAGVRIESITSAHTVSGCLARIRAVGLALNRAEEGEALAQKVESEIASIPAPTNPAVRVLFVFARGPGALNVAGTGTAADEIIRLAGAQNAVTEYAGYRPLTAEAAVQAAPDVILLTQSSMDGLGGADAIWHAPGLKETPAGEHARAVAMDDLLLLGFGPRLPQAIRELQALLYP
ncbi:MAG: ABC transporter substrate-binding protein [Kiritimatiellae bacterium]|nr:ABC transporter substrate-binding protein [Kiritimatiellia bacterium]MCO5069205.1 ABC transporter substrate-binding protein [Kiritimatiellia bacterium]